MPGGRSTHEWNAFQPPTRHLLTLSATRGTTACFFRCSFRTQHAILCRLEVCIPTIPFRMSRAIDLLDCKKGQNKMEASLRQLALNNGLQLTPNVVFQPDGSLKTVATLEALLQQENEVTDPVQTELVQWQQKRGEQLHAQWQTVESVAKRSEDDRQWFEQQFGFRPNSTQDIRRFLLLAGLPQLHWFIDANFQAWSDLNALIPIIRVEFHNV